MIDYSWKKTDPRHSINKRDDIVILRPAIGHGLFYAGTAHVDTKETWCIFTDFEDHSLINADDEWIPIGNGLGLPEKKTFSLLTSQQS